jgi:hypothetical protein
LDRVIQLFSELILRGKEETSQNPQPITNPQQNDLNCIYDIVTASLFNCVLALTPTAPPDLALVGPPLLPSSGPSLSDSTLLSLFSLLEHLVANCFS